MKIYFAGTTGIESRERMVNDTVSYRLISFFYIDKGFAVKYGFDYIVNLKKLRQNNENETTNNRQDKKNKARNRVN